jgi:hypothetical protein
MDNRQHFARPINEDGLTWPDLSNTGNVTVSKELITEKGNTIFRVNVSEIQLTARLLAEYNHDDQSWVITNGFQSIPQHYWGAIAKRIARISPFSRD